MNTQMSADLDAIAREAMSAVVKDCLQHHTWNELDGAALIREALSEAIAQDRKTREDELTRERSQLHFTTERLSEAHKQLAQQSAALVVAEEALNGCDRAFASWQVGQIPGRPEDILALITKVRSALAQLAEAPRENATVPIYADPSINHYSGDVGQPLTPEEQPEPRALTSGEAVEALFCRRWTFENRGGEIWVCEGEHDKCCPCDFIELSADQVIDLIETLRSVKLRAPSRTERSDTAPEVGGKGGVS